MATTPTQAIPYCGPSDAPDVPYWMQRLAERVAVLLDAINATLTTTTSTAGKAARGMIAKATNTNTATVGALAMVDLKAVGLVAGRWYRVRYGYVATSTAANAPAGLTLVSSATADITSAGTTLDGVRTLWTAPIAGSGADLEGVFTFQATATATVNLKMTLQKLGANDVSISARRLLVEDLGANL